jgi:hypothetical protein
MVVVPVVTPVTTPPDMVAMPGPALLHVPPLVTSEKVTVLPEQTAAPEGVIADGAVSTVTLFIVEQPKPFVYEILAVPVPIPRTIPVLPTMAIPVALLHVPPGAPSARAAVEPGQMLTILDGVIAGGRALTVNKVVAVQPAPTEYVIVTTPGVMPVTIPDDEPTVAIAELLLLHVPAPTLLKTVLAPTHTLGVPTFAAGELTTVSNRVAATGATGIRNSIADVGCPNADSR